MRPLSALRTVLLLWAAGLCAAAQFAKVTVALPELAQRYPDAGPSLGFLVSTLSLVGALLGLTAGVFAARLGLRRLLLSGLLLGTGLSLLQATLPPLPLMLASRVLEGVAHLAIVVSAPTLIAAASSDRLRSTAMTLWGTFFGVAFALTAWLGLPLIRTDGVGALFLAHALCTASVAVLVALLTRERCETRSSARRRGKVGWRTIAARHADAWRSPSMAAPAAGWLFYTITFVALLAVLPGTMPPDERAFTAAALPLASIVTSMTLGATMLQRLSAVRVLLIGFAGAALAAAALPLFPAEPAPCIALYAALGLVQGASFAAVPQLNRDRDEQALANGALAQAGNIGNGLGTPLLLTLLAAGGFATMILVVIGCYAAAIAAHLALARRRELAPA